MPTLEWRNRINLLAVAIAYFVSASIGLLWAVKGSSATPLWPPAGIAVAAFLIFKLRVWPGIFIGAFFANLVHLIDLNVVGSGASIFGATLIGVGNVVEAAVIYLLCTKVLKTTRPFDDVTTLFKFIPVTLVGTFVSAFLGTATMTILGLESFAGSNMIFATWFLGDALAIFIVAPLIMSWWPLHRFKEDYNWPEAIAAFASLVVVCGVIFGGFIDVSLFAARPALVIPILLWLSLRFSQREVVTGVAVVSIIAICATSMGVGPFVSLSMTRSIIAEQVFSSMLAVTMLALSAAHTKANNYREQLKNINEELEARVAARTIELERKTRSLEAINHQLIIEARERVAIETKLRDLESNRG